MQRVGFAAQDAALHARRFLELAEAMVDRDGSPTRHHTMASALLFQFQCGDPLSQRERLRFALRAVEHIQRAVDLAPNRRVYRTVELGALLRLAGESDLAGIDPGAVRSLLWQAIELGRELAHSDPTDTTFAAHAVAATRQLAEFEQRQGNLLAAERLSRQAIAATGAGPEGEGPGMALEHRLALARLGLRICQTLGDADRSAYWAQRVAELEAQLLADHNTLANRR